MKKIIFFVFILSISIFLSNKSFSQFQGMIEIKEMNYKEKSDSKNEVENYIPPEAKEEIKRQIKEREEELKNKPKTDEDYEDLENEIKAMKEQLGIPSSASNKPEYQFTKLYFLNNDIRTENISNNSSGEAAIIKVKDEKMLILMEKEKEYIELDFNTLKKMAEMFKNINPDKQKENEKEPNKQKIKKTGKNITILGYKCDEYVLEDNETISIAYICPNFTNFWKMFNDMAKSLGMDNKKDLDDWYYEIMGESGFPFKVIEKTKEGEIISEMEVTKIDKTKPSPTLFTPPKDYKKKSFEEMFLNAK